jgi:hypothetical protein
MTAVSPGGDEWSSGQVLQLYRRILKAAAKFPSIKRASIIADIKVGLASLLLP